MIEYKKICFFSPEEPKLPQPHMITKIWCPILITKNLSEILHAIEISNLPISLLYISSNSIC